MTLRSPCLLLFVCSVVVLVTIQDVVCSSVVGRHTSTVGSGSQVCDCGLFLVRSTLGPGLQGAVEQWTVRIAGVESSLNGKGDCRDKRVGVRTALPPSE